MAPKRCEPSTPDGIPLRCMRLRSWTNSRPSPIARSNHCQDPVPIIIDLSNFEDNLPIINSPDSEDNLLIPDFDSLSRLNLP